MFKFGIYEPLNKVTDPMGSVIINTNATGSPSFEWIYEAKFGGYGVPKDEVGTILSYSDSVSYKIKLLNQIRKIEFANPVTTTTTTTTTSTTTTTTGESGTTTTTTSTTTTTTGNPFSATSNSLEFLAANACYSTNTLLYENCLNGPYRIGSKLYYIDFRVLYLVNLGDQPIYSPIFSVDTQKCTPDYGIFIAAPKVTSNFVVDSNATGGRIPLFKENPKYSNQVDLFRDDTLYKFTVLKQTPGTDGQLTETLPITKQNLTNLIAQVGGIVDSDTPALGQTSIVSESVSGEPIVLSAEKNSTIVLNNTLQAGGFYPFIVFRYISATAQTTPVEIAFTVAPNIA